MPSPGKKKRAAKKKAKEVWRYNIFDALTRLSLQVEPASAEEEDIDLGRVRECYTMTWYVF